MNFLDRFGIVGKIMSGYITIFLISFGTLVFCLYATNKSQKIDQTISQQYYPLLICIKEVTNFANESYSLTNGWINQTNQNEKKKLIELHETQKKRMQNEMTKIPAMGSLKDNLMEICHDIDHLINSQKGIMNTLKDEDSYGDDIMVDSALNQFKNKITPNYLRLKEHLSQTETKLNQSLNNALDEKTKASNSITTTIFISILIFAIIIIGASLFAVQTIQKPIKELSTKINELATGKFIDLQKRVSKDEIGQMENAISGMIDGLKEKAEFADKIGKGQYESDFNLLSEEDKMGVALINMRNNLRKVSEEDKRRNWGTEGLAKFAEILRNSQNTQNQLLDNIISNLVKYVNMNQGALYLVNDESPNHVFIEMSACYAYDRKKHIELIIEIGEGLVGQCYLEKETIYITEIPQNFVKITSGLGEANPSTILLVPLKINEKVYGIIELASFNLIENYVVEFIEKLGESIASTISNYKTNIRTQRLLEQTQEQAEGMKTQEEEMRQNMEELQATQDEMLRKENGYLKEIEQLKAKIYAQEQA